MPHANALHDTMTASAQRKQLIERLRSEPEFDVVILGGGVNGACLYDTLCRQDYKVLLVDQGDFASGTSQSSGMMIWGGLLYLRNLDLASVFQLSADRDQILRQKADWMKPEMMRYLPTIGTGRARWWVHMGLWLYWMMGAGRRRAPRAEEEFSELEMLRPGLVNGSLAYEEAFLNVSDARFVYRWLRPHQRRGQLALNYCRADGAYSSADRLWHLDLEERIAGAAISVRARMVVNCAGIWTDQVNAQFGLSTPFRHALSKGVYLGVERDPRHASPLFFDLGEHDDVISFVPWGPVSLWGPTETAIQEIGEGRVAARQDVDFLLDHYARRFRRPLGREDIVSVRCGVRPLVVDKNYRADRYPLDLSRRQEVVVDRERPWITCYGGKMTGCTRMAARASARIAKAVAASGEPASGASVPDSGLDGLEYATFPQLPMPVPSAAWCARHELCCTLDDYLRRRTNIAQWIPRGGFGRNDANAPALGGIALELANGSDALAAQLLDSYRRKVSDDAGVLLADR